MIYSENDSAPLPYTLLVKSLGIGAVIKTTRSRC
jgi:hypothetical protein